MHISNLDVGMLGANGIVGAGCTDRRGRRVRQQVQGQRQRGRPVLRRRLHQHRRLPRSRQHGVRAQAAGGVRVREQRVRRVHRPREDHGDHRHRRPCRRLRHARRDRRRHGRRGHPRSGHRSCRPRSAGRWSVADRSQDVPLLQPPRHPEPRAQVPHRRRGRRVARTRSDLHVRGTAHRDGHGDPRRHRRHLGRTASRHRHGDRVRREQPGTDTRPVARRRVHPRERRRCRHDPQADLRAGLQRGGPPGDGGQRRRLLRRRGHRRLRRRVPDLRRAPSRVRRTARRRHADQRAGDHRSRRRRGGHRACGRSSTSCSWTSCAWRSTRSSTRRPS